MLYIDIRTVSVQNWFEIQFHHNVGMLEDFLGELVPPEPLVQQVVSQVIAPVSELTAGVLPVLPAVEVGQPPALGEDGAGQIRPAVIEISRI